MQTIYGQIESPGAVADNFFVIARGFQADV